MLRSSRTAAAGLLFLLIPSPSRAQKPDCTLHPPRGTSQADLSRMAKISEKDAESRAVAAVAPNKVSSIISSEPEVVNGCLAWPFDLRFSNKGGVQEVMVDAGDGKILSSEYESPSGATAADTSLPASAYETAPGLTPAPGATPGAAPTPAATPAPEAVAAVEEPRIRKLVDEQEDAWNRGDAKAFAARFQEDGAFTDVFGSAVRGRAEIEKRQTDLFTLYFKGSLLGLKVRRVRFLRPEVALVEADAELAGFHKAPPGVYLDPDKVIRTRLTEVMVKNGADWAIASLSNVEIKTPPEKMNNPEDPLNRHVRSRW
jgi:uncharacterized protein (TIGR02246 family)